MLPVRQENWKKNTAALWLLTRQVFLQPGQSEKMTLEIALDKLTSYSEAEAAWVLEKGSYVISDRKQSGKFLTMRSSCTGCRCGSY